ncbi:hypothetical protein B0H10DRAFT_696473 [Mycena sp. CBHHK59/15]|nr:hypothetical protein B0H10DRAFT_696473 [Mycena sp. CBHHK59/15]
MLARRLGLLRPLASWTAARRAYCVHRYAHTTPPKATVPLEADARSKWKPFIQECRAPLIEVILGSRTLKTWSPSSNGEHSEFQKQLKIPTIRDRPNLLLHNLGSFYAHAESKERVDAIFNPQHTLLVNARGSGKTRILAEGLTRHWGLYFRASPDNHHLGSIDLGAVIADLQNFPRRDREVSPARKLRPPKVQGNEQHAITAVLTARLAIFEFFVRLAAEHGVTDGPELRTRWLLLQLCPAEFVGWDIFKSLSLILRTCSSAELGAVYTHLSGVVFPRLLHETFPETRQEALFCIFDDAHAAAERLPHAIRVRAGERSKTPVLSRIVGAAAVNPHWRVIVAGTRISRDLVRDALPNGAVLSEKRDLGSFLDTPDLQAQFISRFIPDAYLARPEFQLLLQRAHSWLRGRYGWTAQLVALLLQNAYGSPNRVLNRFVERLGRFQPSDADNLVETEPAAFTAQFEGAIDQVRRMNFHSLISRQSGYTDPYFSHMFKTTCISWGALPAWETGHIRRMIALGVSVYRKSTEIQAESLILKAVSLWCQRARQPHTLAGVLAACPTPEDKRRRLVEFLAQFFAETFAKGRDTAPAAVFAFPDVPAWAHAPATLVQVGGSGALPPACGSPGAENARLPWLGDPAVSSCRAARGPTCCSRSRRRRARAR